MRVSRAGDGGAAAIKTAMVLAAGRGERLRPLTDSQPKALMEIRGVTLIGANLRRLARAGVERAVVNLGWLGERIVEHVGDGSRYGLRVVYSPEYDGVLETGGGIRRALPLLGARPFWALNADVWSDIALSPPDLPPGRLGHLVLVPNPPYRTCGDFDAEKGLARNAAQPSHTFSGIAVYRPELFDGTRPERFPLAPLLRNAAETGRLGATVWRGEWADAGTPERLEAIRRGA